MKYWRLDQIRTQEEFYIRIPFAEFNGPERYAHPGFGKLIVNNFRAIDAKSGGV